MDTQGPSMPGEARGQQSASKTFVPKPTARVRLFLLYGVADVCMSLEKWIRAAPEWLEVRLLDLPGHGFRSKEALPACANSLSAADTFDEAHLARQREALIEQLSDEIKTAGAGSKPYALYGFSFGALVMYGIGLRLSAEGCPPLALCVAGRGGPHFSYLSRASCELVAKTDAEAMLQWQSGGGNFQTDNIPTHMRDRAAQLFRCGMLLGAQPAGSGQLHLPLRQGGNACQSSAGMMDEVEWMEGAPKLPKGCRVVAVGSTADLVWPDDGVERWADVAFEPRDFVGKTVDGVEHLKLMNDEVTMRTCFAEVGVQAMDLAASAQEEHKG